MNTEQIVEILQQVFLPEHSKNIVEENRIESLQIKENIIALNQGKLEILDKAHSGYHGGIK